MRLFELLDYFFLEVIIKLAVVVAAVVVVVVVVEVKVVNRLNYLMYNHLFEDLVN